MSNRPMAAKGLTSYRARSPYGWIMIGANSPEDAYSEARRSSDNVARSSLQIYCPIRMIYVDC